MVLENNSTTENFSYILKNKKNVYRKISLKNKEKD